HACAGPRPPGRPPRPALPAALGDAGGRQPLQGRPAGPGGSDDLLPAHGTARPPARPADGRLGVKVARPASTTNPDVTASPSPPPLPALPPPPGRPRPAPRALVGVPCSLLTAAVRPREERWAS